VAFHFTVPAKSEQLAALGMECGKARRNPSPALHLAFLWRDMGSTFLRSRRIHACAPPAPVKVAASRRPKGRLDRALIRRAKLLPSVRGSYPSGGMSVNCHPALDLACGLRPTFSPPLCRRERGRDRTAQPADFVPPARAPQSFRRGAQRPPALPDA